MHIKIILIILYFNMICDTTAINTMKTIFKIAADQQQCLKIQIYVGIHVV